RNRRASSWAPTARPTPRGSSGASTASRAGCVRPHRPRSPTSRRTTCSPSDSRTATGPPAPAAWCRRAWSSTRSAWRRRRSHTSSRRRCRRPARWRRAWRGTSCCSSTSTCSCSATCRPRRGESRVVAMIVSERVALAPYTTLGVGGLARWFVEATDEATLREALAWSRARGVALRTLGGGSNVVVADAGIEALVVRVGLRGVTTREAGRVVDVTAAAGEPWDDLVALTVARGWAGLECLSGIPGLVGATPMQNVGAYGQEVSDTVAAARVAERAGDPTLPRWPQADGGVKLSAAWLIERAGFRRGQREGTVELSTAHALAIVAHDGARAADVLAFARHLRDSVAERFGVRLALEPAVWE